MKYELTVGIIDNWYDWDVQEVDKIEILVEAINEADSVEDWSLILSGSFRDDLPRHIKPANLKLGSNILIFNLGSAHDCPHIGTEHCQVTAETCYAARAEKIYEIAQEDIGGPLSYRRRQQVLWDVLDAETFAAAVGRYIDRRTGAPTDFLRIGESGDFSHNGEISKAEEIATRLTDSHGVVTYCYSAGDYLDWDLADNLVVNASNDLHEYGDRRFTVVESVDDAPDGAMQCPDNRTDGDTSCGECTACMSKHAPDVFIEAH